MATRAPGPGLDVNAKDEARVYDGLVEPFMYTFRQLPSGEGVKMIFWFIATVDEANPVANAGEASYKVAAFGYEEAMNKLTYENDRHIVARAIELVEHNYQRPEQGPL